VCIEYLHFQSLSWHAVITQRCFPGLPPAETMSPCPVRGPCHRHLPHRRRLPLHLPHLLRHRRIVTTVPATGHSLPETHSLVGAMPGSGAVQNNSASQQGSRYTSQSVIPQHRWVRTITRLTPPQNFLRVVWYERQRCRRRHLPDAVHTVAAVSSLPKRKLACFLYQVLCTQTPNSRYHLPLLHGLYMPSGHRGSQTNATDLAGQQPCHHGACRPHE
jgi:hypothetical protein